MTTDAVRHHFKYNEGVKTGCITNCSEPVYIGHYVCLFPQTVHITHGLGNKCTSLSNWYRILTTYSVEMLEVGRK